MIQLKKFTFNPFQENTYLLYNQDHQGIIIDPGCMDTHEQQELSNFIASNDIRPVKLLNTHAHLDHILGNRFVMERYQIPLSLYSSDFDMFQLAEDSAKLYGIPYEKSPPADSFLKEGDTIKLGDEVLEVIFVPGHAPDHLVFYNRSQSWIIGGDVLFKHSIGRTDLPGGNHEQLIENIRQKIFPMEEEIVIYPGHGPQTTIKEEKANNPFF